MSYQPLIKNFPRFLNGGDYNPDQWQGRPEIIDEDFRMMKLAGCNMLTVGVFAWSSLEPEEGRFEFGWLDDVFERVEKLGGKVDMSTPSAAAPLWLVAKHPETRRAKTDGDRRPQGRFEHRASHCWSSPVYKAKVQTINRKLAERYGKHPALGAWHVGNEYSGACYCELCLAKFRRWLQERYSSLEELNAAWWTSFWSRSCTTWKQIDPRHPCLDGLAVDWKRFVTWQCCEFMKAEIAPFRELTPEIPVTTNMMGTNDFFIDNWPLSKICDFVSDDAYCFWDDADAYAKEGARKAFMHDMHRSMKDGKPFLVMEHGVSSLNWTEFYRLKRPGVHKLETLNAIAHGADGMLYFQWRKGRGGLEKFHAAPVDHSGHENTRVFKEVEEVGEIERKIEAVAGSETPVETAVLHDWEVRWALDACSGPTRDNKKHLPSIMAHYRALYDLNVPADVIESVCEFGKYKLVAAPMLFMLRPGVAERLKKFVAEGGTLVATYLSGYVNETNLCFEGGMPGDGLRELFGIWNEELDGFTPKDKQSLKLIDGNELGLEGEFEAVEFAERIHLEGAKALANYGCDFYAGEPALTVNNYGAGKAYYIAARTNDDFLQAFYLALAKKRGVEPCIPFGAPAGVHANIRKHENGRSFLFLLNWTREKQEAELGGKRFKNLLTGGEVAGRIALAGCESTVLEKL